MAEERREVQYRFGLQRPSQRPRGPAIQAPLSYVAPLPRITRLMALAIKLQERLRECGDLDCRTLGKVGHVSRSRITQILNLVNLAPDIQERLLKLAPLVKGREPITEKSLRQLSAEIDWQQQRERFEALMRSRAQLEDRDA